MMKKYFKVIKLDCAACGNELCEKIRKNESVKRAELDFINKRLLIEYDEDKEREAIKAVKDTAQRFGGVQIKEENEINEGHRAKIALLIRIVIAAAILIVCKATDLNRWIALSLYIGAYIIVGYEPIIKAVKNISCGKIFDENFLMVIATVGAFCIAEYAEGVMVMIFYGVGELFQDVAVEKSRKSIEKMMNLKSDYADELAEGKIIRKKPEDVEIGSLILVRAGEKIALDGVVEEGDSRLDMKMLTGESMEKSVSIGDEVLSGSINVGNAIKVRVTKKYVDGTVAKIMELVENSSLKKARSEKYIDKFAKIYTPIVVGAAFLIGIIPSVITGEYAYWIEKALIFLTISCPCALVVSVPLAIFAGIGSLAKSGVMVKGGNYLEALGVAKAAIFDKTGTITTGSMEVVAVKSQMLDEREFLKYAASLENNSNHPLAKAITEKYGGSCELAVETEEIAGKGIRGKVGDKRIALGNEKMMEESGLKAASVKEDKMLIHMSIDGEYAGYMVLRDKIKVGCRKSIENLKRAGIKRTVMLTGDGRRYAEEVARAVGIDECLSELLPDEKVREAERIKREYGSIMYSGDGINDAPVLALSDVGIAMGGMGSDAAIEAADIVIMDDDVSKITLAKKTANKVRKIVKENIFFSIAIKLAVMALGLTGLIGMSVAVFADVGVMVLAVLNSVRCLYKPR